MTGRDNGYSLRALAPLVDFFGPHAYPMLDDEVRQSLAAAFACELAGGFGKPVVLEEFGVSSDFASDDHAADYYRQVLHTSLLAGARGWIAWNNCDYDDLSEEDPYRHHVFEMHFGLTDRTGRPKPQLHALAEFSSLVRELSGTGWERVAGDVALVVPEHFERVLPFTHDAYRSDLGADLLQSYVAAREADLPIGLLRERDGLPDTARLYLVPSAKLLTGPGLQRLRALAILRRDGVRLLLRRLDTEPARALADVAGRDLRDSPPTAVRAGRPDRGRRGGLRARRGARRPRGRDAAPVPRRRRAERPLVSPGRPGRGAGDRGRRARPARAAPARARRRLHGVLHLPARAHGRPHAEGQPRGHLAALLGARHARRGREDRFGSTTRASWWAGFGAARPRLSFSSTLRATPCRPSRWWRTGNPWNPPERSPSARSAWRLPAARSPRRSGQRRVASRRSPRVKGGMRSSDKGLCPTSHPGWGARIPDSSNQERKDRS